MARVIQYVLCLQDAQPAVINDSIRIMQSHLGRGYLPHELVGKGRQATGHGTGSTEVHTCAVPEHHPEHLPRMRAGDACCRASQHWRWARRGRAESERRSRGGRGWGRWQWGRWWRGRWWRRRRLLRGGWQRRWRWWGRWGRRLILGASCGRAQHHCGKHQQLGSLGRMNLCVGSCGQCRPSCTTVQCPAGLHETRRWAAACRDSQSGLAYTIGPLQVEANNCVQASGVGS